MIQPRTMLEVADNSGAKKVQCIRVMGGSNKKYATHRATPSSSPSRKPRPEGSVKKGDVARAVVVRTAKEIRRRQDGSHIKFDRNAAVLPQPAEQPDRHPDLRPSGPRAALSPVHENHLAGARGDLRIFAGHATEAVDQAERYRRGDRRVGEGQAGQGADRVAREASGSSSSG